MKTTTNSGFGGKGTLVRLSLFIALAGCAGEPAGRPCEVMQPQPSLATVDCPEEFELQAARPLDQSLPGALTVKTVIDQAQGSAMHFLDTNAYPFHQRFATERLGWPPGVPFSSEYLAPARRLLLGSVTYYEEPAIWAYELAPQDTAPADMIRRSIELVAAAAFFGPELAFHPTSEEQRARAAELPASIRVVTTEELYAGITYQPLNLGETIGQVRLLAAADLASQYVGPREIVVLDRVPHDISVVAAVITEELQTPLSHVNVLSQQRKTPNMALRAAQERLAGLDGQWVKLTVGPFDWHAQPVAAGEAEAWWQAHRPAPAVIQPADLSVTELVDVDEVGLADIPAAGGKAAHVGELRRLAVAADAVTVRDGFVIPMSFYHQFVVDSGLDADITAMLADPAFQADGNVRRERLAGLRAAMLSAPVDEAVVARIEERMQAQFPGVRVRFRSSTNAEDLQGMSGAGLYQSTSAELGDPERTVARALRTVWASLWNTRAFEERAYASIAHDQVGMAILVHPSYRDESANGVAITANVFDSAPGGEDGFYINVQVGELSVVQPPGLGIVADQLLYYHHYPNQPATYYARSTLLPAGTAVLSRRELHALGAALEAIRDYFDDIYRPPPGYARLPMDVEFKRVGTGEGSTIEVKQARPYPGRGEQAL